MKIFYTVCFCIIITLVFVTVGIRRESTDFYGIAETKEMVINAEFGVEVTDIHITPGQQVSAGDTLIELRSPEIDLKVSEYAHLIDEMKTRSKTQVNLSRAEMRQRKTEHESRIIEIRSELEQLQSQYNINRQLMKQLRSITKDVNSVNEDTSNPTVIKIQNLQKELTRLENSDVIMDDNLHSRISFGVDPLREQLKQYEDQLRLYNEQKEKLYIIAPDDGIVGAVNYKKGEMASAFDTLATVHSKSPSFVLGYIHENIYSSVALGQVVSVRSIADKKNKVLGEVIGVGTRIVEYPVRLRKVPEIQMWGREVTVRISKSNRFLLGEKVMITIEDEPEKFFKNFMGLTKSPQAATLNEEKGSLSASAVHDISWVGGLKPVKGIEASGVQYLSDIGKYCVISDESQMLYLMNSKGEISSEVQIEGLEAIDDMEGITQDDSGYVYIICSQNPTKKGKLPECRRLLVQLRRNGEKFILNGKIKLLDMLAQAAGDADSGAIWKDLIKVDVENRTPDIEGVACRGKDLYISFKDPLIGDSSAIVKISDIHSIFKNGKIKASDVKLWKLLALKDEISGVVYHMSDIQFVQNKLLILSNGNLVNNGIKSPVGRFWILDIANDYLQVVKDFEKLKPEGVTFDKSNQLIFITFDNGSEKVSQFTTLKRSI